MQYQFDVELARRFGLDEAVFVHNLAFWILKNAANGKHVHDGKVWTYNSSKALARIFPFWSPRQIERVVNSCRDKGLIETENLSENRRDRTLWYTITETVKCIYANGEMDFTKRWEPFTQTVGCIKGTDSKPDSNTDKETPAPTKKAYGEMKNVKLSDDEHEKLFARYGSQAAGKIEELSLYLASSGKRYSSHYATILKWLKRDGAKEVSQGGGDGGWL